MKNKCFSRLWAALGLLLLPAVSQAGFRDRIPASAPVLDTVIEQLRETYGLPCVTVAVVKNEKLVYVHAYGYQDTANRIPAVNENLFRIASISKPVTQAAILLLADEGRLSLDDRVFGEGAILGNDFGPVPPGSRKDEITVRNLLEHKGGWQNVPNDPMFAYNDLDQHALIAELLANRPLATAPGENYYYSNFGYLVLGRVIEKVTGMPYEKFVRKAVLKPCGIRHMCIGGNTEADRVRNEVKYYWESYDWSGEPFDVTRMDAHGGWLASAADLARLIVRIDRNPDVPDLVSEGMLSQTYFGNPVWNHTGSLPGTSTVLMRLDDEYSFVVLANYRSFKETFWNDFINKTADAVRRQPWTDTDLFETLKY